jgi:hypothetical protein
MFMGFCYRSIEWELASSKKHIAGALGTRTNNIIDSFLSMEPTWGQVL